MYKFEFKCKVQARHIINSESPKLGSLLIIPHLIFPIDLWGGCDFIPVL